MTMTNMEPVEVVEMSDLASLSLDELAVSAEASHLQADEKLKAGLLFAYRTGLILMEARGRLSSSEWMEWVQASSSIPRSTAFLYTRIARNWSQVVEVGATSITQARAALTGVAPLYIATDKGQRGQHNRIMTEQYAGEASALSRDGMTNVEVARELGISESSVRRLLDPEVARRDRISNRRAQSRYYKARKALKEKERLELARRHGGSADKAYSALRRVLLDIDAAIAECTNSEQQAVMRSARFAAQKATDEIWRAVQLGGVE